MRGMEAMAEAAAGPDRSLVAPSSAACSVALSLRHIMGMEGIHIPTGTAGIHIHIRATTTRTHRRVSGATIHTAALISAELIQFRRQIGQANIAVIAKIVMPFGVEF
jgi:hypothetical protein